MDEISVYWKLVNTQLGRPATARERALCVKQGYDVAYLRAESSYERGAVVESTVALLRDLRESGFGEPQRVAVSSRGDERWRLLAELHRKVEPGEAWAPVSISTYPPFGFAQVGFPRWDTVEITLDHRMSLRELKATLDREWPEMIRNRFVRRTRPLGSLKVALVRHVCLETAPAATWDERCASWNSLWLPQRPAWQFKDTRAYCTEFHKAERSLTGASGGLAWYYSPAAQLRADELDMIAKRGDRAAIRERKRRWRDGLDSLSRANVQVVIDV